MIKLKKCEICGEENFKFLYKQSDKNFNFPENFSMYECNHCKIIFINPQLSYKELEKYYPKEKYYSFGKIIKKEDSKKIRLKLFLYSIYYGPRKKNFLAKTFFLPIKFLVRGIRIAPGKKILDVGCGSGQFLYEMKQFNMEVYGIEPGNFDKKTAKEFNIKSDLIKAKYPKNFFEVITINHVLQHVLNPSEMVKEMHRILGKKGILIFGVSNYNSLAYYLFGKNWYQLDVPRHLFNFSNKTLIKFLKENGFSIIKVRYNSRPGQFADSLYYLLGIKERKGIPYKISKAIFLPLTWIVNFLRIGDQVEVYCKKNEITKH